MDTALCYSETGVYEGGWGCEGIKKEKIVVAFIVSVIVSDFGTGKAEYILYGRGNGKADL